MRPRRYRSACSAVTTSTCAAPGPAPGDLPGRRRAGAARPAHRVPQHDQSRGPGSDATAGTVHGSVHPRAEPTGAPASIQCERSEPAVTDARWRLTNLGCREACVRRSAWPRGRVRRACARGHRRAGRPRFRRSARGASGRRVAAEQAAGHGAQGDIGVGHGEPSGRLHELDVAQRAGVPGHGGCPGVAGRRR
jgi:hypothetical protein